MAMSYAKPPITEAAAEIRLSTPLDRKSLERAIKSFRRLYPNAIEQNSVSLSYNQQSGQTTAKETPDGVRFSSADQWDITLAQPIRLGIFRLAPYQGWESFFSRLGRDLSIFLDDRQSVDVDRIGVRYLNRVDIRQKRDQNISVDDYFNIFISTKFQEYKDIANFNLSFNQEVGVGGLIRNIALRPEANVIIGYASFVLDIDHYREVKSRIKVADIMEIVSTIRGLKNEAFEGCITDKARELFR